MDLARTGGCALVSLTGIGVGLPAADHLLSAGTVVELLLAGFTAAIALALLVAGGVLYRSSVTTANVLRVAGWNALGVVVLAAVMALVYAYQAAAGGRVTAPWLVGAAVVGVSAVAHVLIGVNDVRRIRARELATERERLSVINRLVRHNLRTEAQTLIGVAGRLGREHDGEALAEEIRTTGEDLGEMHDDIKELQALVGGDGTAETRAVAETLDAVAAEARENHPAAELSVAAPADLAVVADERLQRAVAELVENAVEHGGSQVELTAAAASDDVEIRVADDGPGIPEGEWAIVTGDREITPTEHASGLGLWLVRWLVEAYGGELRLEDSDLGGSAVALTLPRA
jgi:two-component system OmpR family sensor kinase